MGPWTYVSAAKSDYYIFCVAKRFDHRLFDDFDAEAVVIINDPGEFERRLHLQVSSKLTGWTAHSAEVEYVDPLFPRADTLNPYFCKHFRYCYQHEFRQFWINPGSHDKRTLAPFLISLGPLQDVCEIVALP